MSDWQVGDLAVCVDATPCECCGDSGVVVGQVYRVLAVRLYMPNGVGLTLDGADSGPHPGHWADRFRKIRPDEHEGNAEDWQLLRETHKRKVSA